MNGNDIMHAGDDGVSGRENIMQTEKENAAQEDKVFGPLVSIVVPVYNAQRYLDETLDSILQQTYASIEVILVDDGSQDDSLALCRRRQAEDERIRVIAQENAGPSAARNRGLREARGEYLMFVDSDDLVHRLALEKMVAAMQEGDPREIDAYCDAAVKAVFHPQEGGEPGSEEGKEKKKLTDEEREAMREQARAIRREAKEAAHKAGIQPQRVDLVIGMYALYHEGDWLGGCRSRCYLSRGSKKFLDQRELTWLFSSPKTSLLAVSVWGKLYRMDIIREHGVEFPLGVSYEEDCQFNLRYYAHVRCAVGIRQTALYYRIRPDSLSKGFSGKQFPFLCQGYEKRRAFAEQFESEELLRRIDSVFFVVIVTQMKKAAASSLSLTEKKAAYRAILGAPQAKKVIASIERPHGRVSKVIYDAAVGGSEGRMVFVLWLYGIKQKLVTIRKIADRKLIRPVKRRLRPVKRMIKKLLGRG